MKLSDSRSVIGVLDEHAQLYPELTFLVDDDREWTYAEVQDLSIRHANVYAGLGVGPGSTVAFYQENSAEQAIASFGVNRLGAIWSPANADYRGEWLATNLLDIGADVLVTDAHLLPRVLELDTVRFAHIIVNGATDLPAPQGTEFHDYDSLAKAPAQATTYETRAGDTTAILWTSGTTGKSKGVMQSNNSWLLWSRRHNDDLRGGVRDGDRFYGCTPMYNSGGWITNIYPALVSANAACIDKKFSVSNFWDRVRFYRANYVMLLGTMHMYLWNAPARDDDADNTMRAILMNPVVPQIVGPFKQRFGVERLFSGYGQSEVMGATMYHSDMPDLKPGSCGFVGLDSSPVETRLLDDDDNEVAVGEVGEICVRPKEPFAIFSGYYNQPDETLRTFRNLWHHTGDLGRVDADGELFFADRKKDSLRHKGRNTSTFEVEHIARQHPQVAQVAAVGVPLEDFAHEETLMICIVPKPDETIDPLEFCRFIDAKAPYFFVPQYVDIVDELPMTPTNKIQKFKIRERGLLPTTWNRETEAPDWQPTRHR